MKSQGRPTPFRPIRVALRTFFVGLALATTLVASLGACSGGDREEPSAAPGDDPTATGATEAPAPLETTSTMGRVTGKLPKAKRSAVREEVAAAVDAWFDAAYVGGDYPRTDFADSWPGFTVGAKADAQADKVLMSNVDIGRDIDSVEATKRDVKVDVLAVKGRAEGATARFVLKFSADGDQPRDVEVRGRLFLTPGDGGWRIFGYDVTKGPVA